MAKEVALAAEKSVVPHLACSEVTSLLNLLLLVRNIRGHFPSNLHVWLAWNFYIKPLVHFGPSFQYHRIKCSAIAGLKLLRGTRRVPQAQASRGLWVILPREIFKYEVSKIAFPAF